MKKQILATLALTTIACSSQAAVLFSTGWDNPNSTGLDSVRSFNTNNSTYTVNTIAITGGGGNNPSPAGFWTVGNSTQVDLSTVSLIKTSGGTEVGAASGNDRLLKGSVFTTRTDFSYSDGAINSGIRYATNTGVWAPQLNSSSLSDARFNVLFEIKPTFEFNSWNIAFNYGTAQTNGAWDNNSAAQNGNADVEIYSIAGDGTISLSSLSFNATSLSGSGPLASLDATNMSTSLSSGNYLLSILLTGKTKTQRYTIDNLVVNASLVPEPTTWALLAGSLTALVVFRRRRVD
ncbi:MAG: hypothetical protein Fur0032_23420 [Terrimicrobiaceae bacterium]